MGHSCAAFLAHKHYRLLFVSVAELWCHARTISVPAVHRLSGVCRENLCMLVPKKLRVTALGRGCHASSGAATSAKCLVYRANLKPGLERTGQPWESEFQIHQRLYRDALLGTSEGAGPPISSGGTSCLPLPMSVLPAQLTGIASQEHRDITCK